MANEIPYKIYKTGVQGKFADDRTAHFSFLPGYNTPHGYTESNLEEFNKLATEKQKAEYANEPGYKNIIAGTTDYAKDPTTGNLILKSSLDVLSTEPTIEGNVTITASTTPATITPSSSITYGNQRTLFFRLDN